MADVGQGHIYMVLGKIMKCNLLTENELAKPMSDKPFVDVSKCAVYG